jgi:hypothetical protein
MLASTYWWTAWGIGLVSGLIAALSAFLLLALGISIGEEKKK